MALRIIGGGIAGLLAANMLRKHEPVVYEAQTSLPNNHGALLRFRSPVVGEVTGIPFREVSVTKGYSDLAEVRSGTPPIPIANAYSYKVTGEVRGRSIMNMEPSTRWIAPDDFCERLGLGTDVRFGVRVNCAMIQEWAAAGDTIISTIPMPLLMDLLGDGGLAFHWRTITSLRARILYPQTEVYQTIYYPGPEPYYRASITGDLLIIEYLCLPEELPNNASYRGRILHDFGLPGETKLDAVKVVEQTYGKLSPVADDLRRRSFILSCTSRLNLFSLGRFATWRQLLLDDLVKDIRHIERMMAERTNYSFHLAGAR